jgi:hypothetical protein
VINGGDDKSIVIPINIYFTMNSLDSTHSGNNYEYIKLNFQKKEPINYGRNTLS